MAENERRVAVVTGGGRGIGRACALLLARDGCDVVIAEIGDFGMSVVPEVKAQGRQAIFVQTDVSRRASVESMVDATLEHFGRLDILINCAGILGVEKPFLETGEQEWQRILNINLNGIFHTCQAVLPHMLERKWGRIVTISSGARNGAPTLAPYAVSKAGVVALMNSIANSYARQNVFANCVEPGRVLTDMVVPRFSSEYLANPPGVAIGRYAEPEEIAEVVAFLCSERNTYITGAIYSVKGSVG